MNYRLLLALLLLLPGQRPSLRSGTSRSVTKAGTDSGNCAGAPCLTIIYGLSQMASGDTLTIGSGTYVEQITNGMIPGGVAGTPTYIQSATQYGAVIRPATCASAYAINVNNANYIVFDGIDADATNCNSNGGLFIQGTSTNITFKNGKVHDGSAGSGFWGCISTNTGTTNHVFLNNQIFGCGVTAAVPANVDGITLPGSGNIVDGNSIHNNGGNGIDGYNAGGSANANIYRDNAVYSNGVAGVLLSSGSANTAYNNVVYSNAYAFQISGGCSSCTVYNNTISSSTSQAVRVDAGVSGAFVQNNIFYSDAGGAITDSGTTTTCSNNLNATVCGATEGTNNPLFVSVGTGNFHVTVGSPAGRIGLNLTTTFTTDADGIARPSSGPWDAGAYVVPPCVGICLQQSFYANNAAGGSTLNIAFQFNQTTGNLNIVAMYYCTNSSCAAASTGGTCSATDDHSNTYTAIQTNIGTTGLVICILYARNITGGANTVHVTTGGIAAPTYLSTYVSEWSGLDTAAPLDRSAKNNGTGTALTVSTAMATTVANELVFGFTTNLSGGLTLGSGYAAIPNSNADNTTEYKLVSATAIQTATWAAASSSAWGANIATFKQVSAAPSAHALGLLGVGR